MYQTLIAASELNAIIDQSNLVILDCRISLSDIASGRRDYEKSHIPNAQYAHLDDDLSGEIIKGKTGRHPFPIARLFAKKLGEWGIDQETQVIVYDQSHGGIAARLWFLLKWLGHENVAVLDGGWKHWLALGYSVTADLPETKVKVFNGKPNPALLVDVQFMEEHINDPEYIYIDSRAAARYRGEVEPIDPVAGHIPSAISAPFLDNLGPDGLFLKKEALAHRFLDILKAEPKGQAIFYCGSGVTACHNLLAMHHLGFKSPKLFPGSWSEWIIDEGRGVAVGDQK